ncbi:MAG: 6-chlorohydroxyquinol-1,2-dioxygenase [Candidatus Dormibacteraeota bacterium]|nr:6-chlorohydroxyquinol-1,2-dioxygenase [Candidatus Dormibacteraeota bacterium]MBO0762818.1 6-chlorohydroxyquinol-1,2-dioxygenase [Candidatus Dormibacteraeota bacterium]
MTRPAPQEELLDEVVQSFAKAPDPRLREILQAAARHLHAFVSETGLTREEWRAGIDFLTAVGQKCDEVRQEFILMSDTFGVSSLVEMQNFAGVEGATENTVLGPFYVPGSPVRDFGASILENEDPGPRLLVQGRVVDLQGKPIAGALLDIWQNATNRLYAVQDPNQDPNNLRGKFYTRDDGSFEFRAVKPVPYPIPDDGPIGEMLRTSGRHPWRAAHIHVVVSAPGYKTLTTHIFDRGSDYLDSDAVFGVRDSLIVDFAKDPSGDGLLARFDIALEPEAEKAAAPAGKEAAGAQG